MIVAADQPDPITGPLKLLLRSFRLRGFEENYELIAEHANTENLTYESFLYEVSKVEAEERRNRKIARRLKESKLPRDKIRPDSSPNGLEAARRAALRRDARRSRRERPRLREPWHGKDAPPVRHRPRARPQWTLGLLHACLRAGAASRRREARPAAAE